MNPKTKAILDQVRILAQTYPDFVYPDDPDTLCKYNTGGDPEYPELSGCIVGQAARKAGIDTSDWDVIPNDPDYSTTVILTRIADRLGEDARSPEAKVLLRTQELQDRGVPWGEAYAEAMEKSVTQRHKDTN